MSSQISSGAMMSLTVFPYSPLVTPVLAAIWTLSLFKQVVALASISILSPNTHTLPTSTHWRGYTQQNGITSSYLSLSLMVASAHNSFSKCMRESVGRTRLLFRCVGDIDYVVIRQT